MNDRFVLALDEGTSSTRSIVFDQGGNIRGVAQTEFEQFFPKPGLVEHDATEIWRKQHEVMLRAIGDAGISAGDLDAIGITNQRETVILWDRATGEPLYKALVWQDRRTTQLCKQLKAQGVEERP